MRRAHVELEKGFWLDRCPTCGGTWFDAGEWEQIAAHQMERGLDDLWDPQWQRHAREAKAAAHWREDIAATFGPRTLELLAELAQLLRGHPKAQVALTWLQEQATQHRDGG